MGYKKLFLSILFVILAGVAEGKVSTDNINSRKNKRNRLQQEIDLIDKRLKDNASKSRSVLSELSLIRKKIEDRNELIAESDNDIKIIQDKISNKRNEITNIQNELDTLSSYYSDFVLRTYKNRDVKVWYMYILASENITRAFRRITYLRNLSSEMNRQGEKIKTKMQELEEARNSLIKTESVLNALRIKRVNERNLLSKEESSSKDIVNQLNRESSRYKRELSVKKRQVDALNREIERLILESSERGKGKDIAKTTAIDYVLDKEFAKNQGKLPWPANGPVIEKFGQHNHPVFTRVKLPFNNGISIELSQGATVKSVFTGVVKKIVVMPGYNQCILIQHGNYFSFYCKLEQTFVKSGDKVKTGDIIGTVGTIAGNTQLHFQIWKGTTPQNPEKWLR